MFLLFLLLIIGHLTCDIDINHNLLFRSIYLDAFFELISIQKAMFHEVSFIIPVLPTERSGDQTKLPYKDYWMRFANFLIDSLHKHIEHVKEISLESMFTRYYVTSTLELVEFECKVQRFKLRDLSSGGISPTLQQEIKDKCNEIERSCLSIRNETFPSIKRGSFKRQCNERIEAALCEIEVLKRAAIRSRI